MHKKTSRLILVTAVALLAGCAAANKTGITNNDTPLPPIQKDTKTEATVSTIEDQFALAFNEIGWARQSSSLALNPPSLSSRDGCVNRRVLKGNRYLSETYACTRQSDSSDSQPSRRYALNGVQWYQANPTVYQVSGRLSSTVTATTNETLVAAGSTSRLVQIVPPVGLTGSDVDSTDLKSSTFRLSSATEYVGEVPKDSKHQSETWTSKIDGSFRTSASVPLTILAGTTLTFSYLPEAEANIKRGNQIITLTATTDVTFVEVDATNGTCLRPVGTFTSTINQGGVVTNSTITASGNGYTRSSDGTSHSWGLRCLER